MEVLLQSGAKMTLNDRDGVSLMDHGKCVEKMSLSSMLHSQVQSSTWINTIVLRFSLTAKKHGDPSVAGMLEKYEALKLVSRE